MFLRLFILFTVVPLIELSLLSWMAEHTGLANTILLVLFTGALGAWLAKQQGLRAVQKIQQTMAAGKPPAGEVVDGVLILIAGAVLITPGLLTDTFGFSLLVPQFRVLLRRGLVKWFKKRAIVTVQSGPLGPFAESVNSEAASQDPNVIDAEYTRVSDD